MANPDLVAYIREHAGAHGEAAVREQLRADGISPEEVEAAFAQYRKPASVRKPKPKLAVFAILGGVALVAIGGYLSLEKPAKTRNASEEEAQSPPNRPTPPSPNSEDARIFNGHYGYMIKMPPGYQATATFDDPGKTHEVVFIHPTATSPTNFQNEGLYGQLGIIRIEVGPRRRGSGSISMDSLKAVALAQMKSERASFTTRTTAANDIPAFIVVVVQPFSKAVAYLVGKKVYYVVTAGADNELFNQVLQTLAEVDPHDKPGHPGGE
jgi:hypothetical protein